MIATAIQWVVGTPFIAGSPFSWRLPLPITTESNLWQVPGLAPFAVKPSVGRVILDEPPFLRVPGQLAVVPVSQVAQVADRYRASADLDITDRSLACADAIQPVALMARRLVEVDVLFTQR